MMFLRRLHSRVCGQRRSRATLFFTAVLSLLLVVLFLFDPETSAFYPACPTYRWFHWKCATCGGLRTVHSLLHGEFVTAWKLNPFVVLVLAVGFLESVRSLIWGANTRRLAWLGIAALGSAVVFTLARN